MRAITVKSSLWLLIVGMLLGTWLVPPPVYGAEVNAVVSGAGITVTGSAEPFSQISVQVTAGNRRVYINQGSSAADGTFSFVLPVPPGNYQVKVSSHDNNYPIIPIIVTGGGQVTPTQPPVSNQAQISINGYNGELLALTTVSWEGTATVLSLLNQVLTAKGISLEVRPGYVVSIGGQREYDKGPTSGWKYQVNGSVPGVGAGSWPVKDGDIIEWFYAVSDEAVISTPIISALPSFSSIDRQLKSLNLPAKITLTSLTSADLASYVDKVTELMKPEQALQIKNDLAAQQISISLTAKPGTASEAKADLSEVGLQVPVGALTQQQQLTVKELSAGAVAAPGAASSVYEFGPSGTAFKQKVQVSIRVALDNIKPGKLVMAWYDTKTSQWMPIPAVVDASTGLVTGQIDHFTSFAVFNLDQVKNTVLSPTAIIGRTAAYLKTMPLTDWSALGLLVSGQPGAQDYGLVLAAAIKAANGQVSKVTDLERQVLLAGALSLNPASIGGQDLLKLIYNNDRLTRQGTNGVAYGLLALNSCKAEIPSSARWNQESMIKWLLAEQQANGAWALTRDIPGDVDVTAMTLTAMAPYQHRPEVKVAIDKALNWLSGVQLSNGGYISGGVENSESSSQVIVALCSLGISPEDARFIKAGGSLLNRWVQYQNNNGGFAHILKQESNSTASEQALMALAAWQRYLQGQPAIYQFGNSSSSFDDAALISGWAQGSVEKAYQLGIIKGAQTKPLRFAPQFKVTRAELVAMLDRMQVPVSAKKASVTFNDLTRGAWYYDSITRAAASGWICGTPEGKFEPDRGVTRQEMALILVRIYPNLLSGKAPNFSDINLSDPAARDAIAKVAASGLMLGSNNKFDPNGLVTREMTATILMRKKN